MERCSKAKPCPICRKPDWCLCSENGDAICARIADGALKFLPGCGWLHKQGAMVKGDKVWQTPRAYSVAEHVPSAGLVPRTTRNWMALQDGLRRNLLHKNLEEFSEALGINIHDLLAYGAGANPENTWLTFPMYNGEGDIIGIKMRDIHGQKKSVSGSANGVFLRNKFATWDLIMGRLGGDRPIIKTLYITEGPTDACAASSIGLEAIGRPGCLGAERITARTIMRLCGEGSEVIIVADGDGPGLAGSRMLSEYLVSNTPFLPTIIYPPRIKDMREWVKLGARKEDVEALWQ